MKLSILIPVYNEKLTILKLLKEVEAVKIPGIEKEIIIVDDKSTDGSKEILRKVKYKVFFHEKNQGKGAAIKTAIKHATGDILVIQDADLEYDPNDYNVLIKPILEGKTKVVYGSRFLHPKFKPAHKLFYFGNLFLSLMTRLLYFRNITDMETCYKMFKKEVLIGIDLKSRGFELEPEITTKIIKKGYKIIEVPIKYHARKIEEGKKLKPIKDGVKALWYLIKHRFGN
jgi:dolichol-phosphate mannosyltransferase